MEYEGSLMDIVPRADDGPAEVFVVDDNAQVYGGPLTWWEAVTLRRGLEARGKRGLREVTQ